MKRAYIAVLAFFAAASIAYAAPAGAEKDRSAGVSRVSLAGELARQTTAQAVAAPAAASGYTAFDEFSAVNDPLHRGGSREMLKKAVKEIKPAAPAFRDAPSDRVRPLKRAPRRSDPAPKSVDPLKAKTDS